MSSFPCRWRGQQQSAGRFACHSSKLFVCPDGVTLDTCTVCYCRDHEPSRGPARPAAVGSICRHLGPPTGLTVDCGSCGEKKTKLFVYVCNLPQIGTTNLAACRSCLHRS